MRRLYPGGRGLKVCAYRLEKPVHKEIFAEFRDIRAIDSTYLFGVEHIEFAHKKAKKAFKRGENISSNIYIETLVRASGQRQIKKALEAYGLRGSREIIVFGDNFPGNLKSLLRAKELDIRLDRWRLENLKDVFQISDDELQAMSEDPEEAVKELIKERISLV
jgi:tRNA threonylcarbamoyladenosine modification (KEOPS) complex Cgi121 subunit